MEFDFRALMEQANENRLMSADRVRSLSSKPPAAKSDAARSNAASRVSSMAVQSFLERKKRDERLKLQRDAADRKRRLDEHLRSTTRAGRKAKDRTNDATGAGALTSATAGKQQRTAENRAEQSNGTQGSSSSSPPSLARTKSGGVKAATKEKNTPVDRCAPGHSSSAAAAGKPKAEKTPLSAVHAAARKEAIDFAKLMQVAERNKSLPYVEVCGQRSFSAAVVTAKRAMEQDVCNAPKRPCPGKPVTSSSSTATGASHSSHSAVPAGKARTSSRLCEPVGKSVSPTTKQRCSDRERTLVKKRTADRTSLPVKKSRPLPTSTRCKGVDVANKPSALPSTCLPRCRPSTLPTAKYPAVRTASSAGRVERRPASKVPTSQLSRRELELRRREFLRRYGHLCRGQPTQEESDDDHGDDEDDSYDSEMGDFIDDTPIGEEDEQFVSRQIKMTFGYDRSKYRYADDSDDVRMESNFRQICKEEARSSKLALLEDLTEFQREQKLKKARYHK